MPPSPTSPRGQQTHTHPRSPRRPVASSQRGRWGHQGHQGPRGLLSWTLWAEEFETSPGTPPSTNLASLPCSSHLRDSGSLLPPQGRRSGPLQGLQGPRRGREQALPQVPLSLEGIRSRVVEQLLIRARSPHTHRFSCPWSFPSLQEVNSASISPSPCPHQLSVPSSQRVSLNIPSLFLQARILVQPVRLGWGSAHAHRFAGLPCQHTQPTKFPSMWGCPAGGQCYI